MTESPGTAAAPHQKNNHLGLKILLGLIAVATLIYTWKALTTQLSMAVNTIVWIGAIILMVYIFMKIKKAEENERSMGAQE